MERLTKVIHKNMETVGSFEHTTSVGGRFEFRLDGLSRWTASATFYPSPNDEFLGIQYRITEMA